MKALVVYESMFGNTEAVARAIAAGLEEAFEVTLADVSSMPRAFGMDLLVIGGPTHNFGMSRPSTRAQAAERETVRSTAVDVGIREYLDCSPLLGGMPAAAFGTRVDKRFLLGSAARRAQHQLRRLGCHIVLPAESFLVGGATGPLEALEKERSRQWGATLAETVTAARHAERAS